MKWVLEVKNDALEIVDPESSRLFISLSTVNKYHRWAQGGRVTSRASSRPFDAL